MVFPLSPSSFNFSVARNRITCLSKKHHRHVIPKVTVCNCNTTFTRVTSARSVVEKIVKWLGSVVVVPIVLASFPISAFVAPLVDYVASPGVAEAVLYSPDTKVPRTGEVALRRAIPASANMKAIQRLVLVKQSVISLVEHGQAPCIISNICDSQCRQRENAIGGFCYDLASYCQYGCPAN